MRRISNFFRIGIFVTMALNFYSSPAQSGIFHPKTFTLHNGLLVVLVENHMAPVASVGLLYKVGTADDPIAFYGISHFLEHLMFKGTKEVKGEDFKRLISSRGGSINAFTSSDETVYTCDIAIEHLPFILKLEADRMQNLAFDQKEVEAELQVVLEERRMRIESSPFGAILEASLGATFWHHPYGIPGIGYPHHIKAYTLEASRNHYHTWYTPNNAVLIVSGDIKLDELKPIVEKYFGAIPSKEVPKRVRIQEPSHEGIVTQLEQESPRISLVNISWNFAAPNHRIGETQYFYPLIVLSQILGGNHISRLYRTFVEERKLAVDADSDYSEKSFDPEIFHISATLAPDADLATLKAAVEGSLKDLVQNGITDEELTTAKRDILASLAFARDGNNSSVMAFVGLGSDFTVDQIEKWPDSINAVTKDQVNAAAKAILGGPPVLITTVYPQGYKERQAAAPTPLKRAGLG